MMDDLISRQAAIDALRDAENYAFNSFYKGLAKAHKIIADLPSAQPDLDEWCTDCKEYDQERHCCPRFNRVIKQTKEDFEAQNEIIHCTDCRYHGTAICRIWSRYGTINVPGYGFCYRAERKEQDEGD